VRHMGAFRFMGALLLIGIVGTLMALSFAAGAASQGVVIAGSDGHAFGFFGFLLILLVIFMIFGAIGGGHRRHMYMHGPWGRYGPQGPGNWQGYGRWDGEDWPSGPKAALEDWHQRAHAQPGNPAPGSPTTGNPTSGPAENGGSEIPH
jgi:hypothetical protein